MQIKLLGIDPGYDRCGWAILNQDGDKFILEAAGLFTSMKTAPHFDRFKSILEQLANVLDQYHPTQLAIETVLFSKNVTTAMKVAEVKGAIIGQCLEHNLTIKEVNPMQVKSAVTGNGKADKHAIIKMLSFLITMPQTEKWLDDTYDAIAIGYAGLVQ